MLTSFGLFWIGEGAGIHWPGSDAFLLVLVAVFAALSAARDPVAPSVGAACGGACAS